MSTRLSRVESHAATRSKLIESATVLYLREGYNSTSNVKVAEAAGYSRGAVYSNFRSKEELALAVLDKFLASELETLAQAVGRDTLDERFAAFEDWMVQASRERGWAVLKSELIVASHNNPQLREELAARDEVVRESLSQMLAELFGEAGLALLPLERQTLVRLLMSIAKGVAMDSIISPDPTKSPDWLSEITALVRSLAAMIDLSEA
ncbi:TetR/AcrR family transcriptional regulator [Nocardia fluminea]|uniref:TetR/AcrR family transcriptional regulator n=1 Tax=Nocardia fluminea TaxID=134984 RepID=UPI003D0CD778